MAKSFYLKSKLWTYVPQYQNNPIRYCEINVIRQFNRQQLSAWGLKYSSPVTIGLAQLIMDVVCQPELVLSSNYDQYWRKSWLEFHIRGKRSRHARPLPQAPCDFAETSQLRPLIQSFIRTGTPFLSIHIWIRHIKDIPNPQVLCDISPWLNYKSRWRVSREMPHIVPYLDEIMSPHSSTSLMYHVLIWSIIWTRIYQGAVYFLFIPKCHNMW